MDYFVFIAYHHGHHEDTLLSFKLHKHIAYKELYHLN